MTDYLKVILWAHFCYLYQRIPIEPTDVRWPKYPILLPLLVPFQRYLSDKKLGDNALGTTPTFSIGS